MKRLLSVAFCGLILAGCGDSTTDEPAPAETTTSTVESTEAAESESTVAETETAEAEPEATEPAEPMTEAAETSVAATDATDTEDAAKEAATDPKAEEELVEKPKTPEEQLAAVKADFDEDMQAFMKRYRAAKPADRRALIAEQPDRDVYAERVLKIADENPGTDLAFDAVLWAAQSLRSSAASETLVENFTDREEVAPMIMMMERDPGAEGTLRELVDSEDPLPLPVKAAATYALGKLMVGKNTEEAATLLRKVVDDYGDVEISFGPRSMKPADRAEGALFEAENLQIGMVAPDIVSADLDGVEFKLSDYRGKVVMLDFWGDW